MKSRHTNKTKGRCEGELLLSARQRWNPRANVFSNARARLPCPIAQRLFPFPKTGKTPGKPGSCFSPNSSWHLPCGTYVTLPLSYQSFSTSSVLRQKWNFFRFLCYAWFTGKNCEINYLILFFNFTVQSIDNLCSHTNNTKLDIHMTYEQAVAHITPP